MTLSSSASRLEVVCLLDVAVVELQEVADDPHPLPLDVAELLDEELGGGSLEAELLGEGEPFGLELAVGDPLVPVIMVIRICGTGGGPFPPRMVEICRDLDLSRLLP